MFEALIMTVVALLVGAETVSEAHNNLVAFNYRMAYDANPAFNRARQNELTRLFKTDLKSGEKLLGRRYVNIHPYAAIQPNRAMAYNLAVDAAVRQMARREGWTWYDQTEASLARVSAIPACAKYENKHKKPFEPTMLQRHQMQMLNMVEAEMAMFGE